LSINPTRPCASIAALSSQRDVLELGPLHRIGEHGVIRDQLGVGFHHDVEDAEAIGAQRRTVSVTSTMASASVAA